MSDADGNIIPYVEDDQGEGVKDFIDLPLEYPGTLKKLEEEINKTEKYAASSHPKKTDRELLEDVDKKLDALIKSFKNIFK